MKTYYSLFPLNLLSLLFFSIFFLTCFLPLLPIASYDYYNHKRIAQLILLILSSTLLLIQVKFYGATKIKIPKIFLLFYLVFILFGSLSALFTKDYFYSLFYVSHFFILGLLLLLSNQINNKTSILAFIYALIFAFSLINLVFFLNIIFTLMEGKAFNANIIYTHFFNIRFFNQVQVFILPILTLLTQFPKLKLTALLLLILNLVLMFIGDARGALLTWLIILPFIFVTNATQRKAILLIFIVTVISYITFFLLNSLSISNIATLKFTASEARFITWAHILENLNLSHLIIGNGPSIPQYIFHGDNFAHPHNSALEILNEWGLIAFICICYLITCTVFYSIAFLNKKKKDLLTAYIFYSWLSGVIYSLVSGVIVTPIAQTLLFITWGILLGRITKKPSFTLAYFNKFTYLTLLLIIVIYHCIFSYLTYININIEEGYSHGPRFWSIGKGLNN